MIACGDTEWNIHIGVVSLEQIEMEKKKKKKKKKTVGHSIVGNVKSINGESSDVLTSTPTHTSIKKRFLLLKRLLLKILHV